VFIEELSFTRVYKIKAGYFSAALSSDGQLYVWGQGSFGEFYTPHRVKSAKKLDILDFQVSRAGCAALLTRTGKLYTWGPNENGQLGHGDFEERATPARVRSLEGKKVTSIGVGDSFIISLGHTMPQKDYEKFALNKGGILKQKSEQLRAQSSQKDKRRNSQHNHSIRSGGSKKLHISQSQAVAP
jgi:alpha-tubulin suppressor-like RCC1 family protein